MALVIRDGFGPNDGARLAIEKFKRSSSASIRRAKTQPKSPSIHGGTSEPKVFHGISHEMRSRRTNAETRWHTLHYSAPLDFCLQRKSERKKINSLSQLFMPVSPRTI